MELLCLFSFFKDFFFNFYATRFFYAQIQCLTHFYNKQNDIDGSKMLQGGDIDNLSFQLDTDSAGQGKYKIKPGWQLHLYISQLPCNS